MSHQPSAARLRVEIHGAVQGVGFRPFVYRLATELALNGWVINDSRGVFIEVEGDEATLARFLERLRNDKPPRAIIHSIDSEWLDAIGYSQFEIRHSDDAGAKTVLVLPDIATCDDCLREVFDPRDRRARYPFTNCTNCGPRFSIIEALPYDRPNTTMRKFALCPDCQREYDDPRDRRFHAQPNACPVCGPKLEVQSSKFKVRSSMLVGDDLESRTLNHEPRTTNLEPRTLNLEPIAHTAQLLTQGYIVAVKGLGGFLLMADARNADTLARLRERKPRRDKPFALMARDLVQARALVEIDAQAEALLASPESPIVLLRRKPDAPIADNVAPENPYLGVMLPYTPLHHLLLRALDFPVVATSGNLSDEPICTDENEAVERLGGIADFFLVHDRPIARHVDDSVMTVMAGEPRLLRRARGYAPLPVLLAREIPTILAVGAHLKNTIALSVRNQVFISQHIGDLETPEALNAFERVIADFLQLYEATPIAIAHDLHPDYLSTRWAREAGGEGRSDSAAFLAPRPALLAVQHHHAHLAACLAENRAERALGVTWDGTGYGSDGTIWGGEFLLGDAKDFARVAHLRAFRLPGGDAAIKEPRRAALALLWEMYGDAALERDDLAPIRAFSRAERKTLAQMLSRGINAPITTSAGRLFDGIAALIGLHQHVSFEGQAAMAVEYLADASVTEAYTLQVKDEGGRMKDESFDFAQDPSSFILHPSSFILDWESLLRAVLGDLSRGVERGMIAARFHNALVEAIVAVAQKIGEENVALSGGCFQNRLLTERAATRLAQAGFRVLLHQQVPPNDGCIAFGQVVVAANHFRF
ncbi:MAG: carbamoyltransferase HypF [Chloroflexi bacterium]|nr:carbamoyltransferase HypF [Chloroflexota bacterium]